MLGRPPAHPGCQEWWETRTEPRAPRRDPPRTAATPQGRLGGNAVPHGAWHAPRGRTSRWRRCVGSQLAQGLFGAHPHAPLPLPRWLRLVRTWDARRASVVTWMLRKRAAPASPGRVPRHRLFAERVYLAAARGRAVCCAAREHPCRAGRRWWGGFSHCPTGHGVGSGGTRRAIRRVAGEGVTGQAHPGTLLAIPRCQ